MERMWYYAKSGSSQKEGPIAENDLKSIISIGQLTGRDLVWSEGMKNWATIDQVPELAPPGTLIPSPAVATTSFPSAGIGDLPAGLTSWMQFYGVLHIVLGVISCLTCVGIFTGIFMLIGGLALVKAKGLLLLVDEIPASMLPFFEKLKSFFMMLGIMYLVGIALAGVGVLMNLIMVTATMSKLVGAH